MEYSRFDAKYFDGLTSLPKAALIQIHLQQQLLYIQFEDASIQQINFAAIVVQDGPNYLQIRDCSNMAAYLELEVDAKQRKYLLNILAKKNIHLQFKQLGIFKILLIAVFLFTALITTYFLVLPPLAEKTVEILPTSVDDQIGDTFFSTMVPAESIDQKRSKALNAFAAELKLYNKRRLHFNVVQSAEVNAFAMPNGEIVIYTGLLDQLDTPAQLVALIGHEVSHVNERHSMKLLSRNLAGYMVISLILGDVSGITAVLADNAQQLHQLSYARGHEQEADELGLQILLDNHQDPQAMLQLFQKLKAQHGTEEIPELLSSHPLPKSRIRYIQKRILQQKSLVVQNPDIEMWFKRLRK
jgi:predicted Zn-dependent protease